jgi:hypothetical protein
VGAIHKDLFPKAIQGYSSQFQPIQPFLAPQGTLFSMALGDHSPVKPESHQVKASRSKSNLFEKQYFYF